MVTLQYIKDNINSFSKEERKEHLTQLMNMFSSVSHQTLLEFQIEYDKTKPFEEFIKDQNITFCMCIDLELSELGSIVRQQLNLPKITLETNIKKDG